MIHMEKSWSKQLAAQFFSSSLLHANISFVIYLLLHFTIHLVARRFSFEESKQPEPMFMILTSSICPIGSIFYFRTTTSSVYFYCCVWFMAMGWKSKIVIKCTFFYNENICLAFFESLGGYL